MRSASQRHNRRFYKVRVEAGPRIEVPPEQQRIMAHYGYPATHLRNNATYIVKAHSDADARRQALEIAEGSEQFHGKNPEVMSSIDEGHEYKPVRESNIHYNRDPSGKRHWTRKEGRR